MTEPLLHMDRVSKSFGPTVALREVNLTVASGDCMALIGENGAGKSTLMKILSGAISADAGSMTLAGQGYAPQGPLAARRAGVAMIYQELNLAPDLSVEDNVMLGQEEQRSGLLRRQAQRPRVREALDLLGHGELHPNAIVGTLSIGAQQLVEIARALVSKARLIVFDEPTSSLTQHDAEHLFSVIRRLREQGIAIIYISHFLEEIREVCDRYTVLRDGESVGAGVLEGMPEEEIVRLMVGRSVDELFPSVEHTPGENLLSLEALSGKRLPLDVNLSLRRGEILGVAGLVGAGRTELLRCLLALDPVASGRVRVGKLLPGATPAARIRAGLGMVSEDRKGEGLAQGLSLADNVSLSRLQPYSFCGLLNLAERRAAVADWLARMQVKAHSVDQPVNALSGGNQQKVALARLMHQDADVLLLDEPTRGIDVGTKAEIYRLVGELAARGKGIIFVSSYLPELMAVCDRIAVMARGRIRDIRAAGEWTEEEVMATAITTDDHFPVSGQA